MATKVEEKLRTEAGIRIHEDWQDPALVYAALDLVHFEPFPAAKLSSLYWTLQEGPTEDDDAYYDAREVTGQ